MDINSFRDIVHAEKSVVSGIGWDSVVRVINASDKLLEATWCMDEGEVEDGILAVHTVNIEPDRMPASAVRYLQQKLAEKHF